MRPLSIVLALAAVALPAAHAETITNFSLVTSAAGVEDTYDFSLSATSPVLITQSPIAPRTRRLYSDVIVNGDLDNPFTIDIDNAQGAGEFLAVTNPANGVPISVRVFVLASFFQAAPFSADRPVFLPGTYPLLLGSIIPGNPFDLDDIPSFSVPLDSATLVVSQYSIVDPPPPPTAPDPTTPTAVTPEPASLALLGTGLAGLGTVLRRRSR